MVDFIQDNPALNSFYQTQNNERAQDMGNVQVRAAKQSERANNAVDEGIRSWLTGAAPQTTPARGQDTPQPPAPPPTQAPMPPPTQARGAPPAATPAPAPAQPQASGALSSIGVTPPPSTMATMAQTPGTGRALM